jgi:hypothetical protein
MPPKFTEILISALKRRENEVPFNKSWQFVYNEWNLGVLNGRKLQLNSKDYAAIRQILSTMLGCDPFDYNPNGTRIDVAGRTRNEKSSTVAPLKNTVLVTSDIGTIKGAHTNIQLEKGMAVSTDFSLLDENWLSTIVVIENFEAFVNWHKYHVPEELTGVAAIYRGDNGHNAGLKSLLASRDDINLIAFTDYDPAGFAIAKGLKSKSMLLPVIGHEIFDMGIDKPSAYQDQVLMVSRDSPGLIQQHINGMISASSTVTQEAMCAHKIILSLTESDWSQESTGRTLERIH